MSTELQTFSFNTQSLRTINDEQGNPWFIAMDVADILEFTDTQAMTRRLDEDEIQNRQIVGFGNRGVSIINESGLYSAVLNSQKPAAKPFKKWVTATVLPTIRKTGSYIQGDLFGNGGKIKPMTVKAAETIYKMTDSLTSEKETVVRAVKHTALSHLCTQYGIKMAIPLEIPKAIIHPDVEHFWKSYSQLNNKGALNHIFNHAGVAINVPYFYRKAVEAGIQLKPFKQLIPLLKENKDQPLIHSNHCLYSRILKKTIRCAVFDTHTREKVS